MFKKFLSSIIIICFFLTSVGLYPQAHADSVLGLPVPGTMITLSAAYQPAMIKGLIVHKDNPFLFDFIVDTGNSGLAGDTLKNEGDRLVKYFFACLTIPEKDLWVNLSPYEKDRMVPQALGQTALGRDLLAQDYILKQLTASLIYPEKDLGKAFWDRVYAKAWQMYGTTQIPVNTFNKVWIVADNASVYEHGQTAFVVSGHMKVMLEEDYLALTKHQTPTRGHEIHSIASQIIKQIILPEIEREVNTGKNFSTLRQIFNSLILASWYKRNLKEALLTQFYADKSTVKGVIANGAKQSREQIYDQYLKAYKKGVFNYIKEDAQPDGQTIQRKYFSGGFDVNLAMTVVDTPTVAVVQAVDKVVGKLQQLIVYAPPNIVVSENGASNGSTSDRMEAWLKSLRDAPDDRARQEMWIQVINRLMVATKDPKKNRNLGQLINIVRQWPGMGSWLVERIRMHDDYSIEYNLDHPGVDEVLRQLISDVGVGSHDPNFSEMLRGQDPAMASVSIPQKGGDSMLEFETTLTDSEKANSIIDVREALNKIRKITNDPSTQVQGQRKKIELEIESYRDKAKFALMGINTDIWPIYHALTDIVSFFTLKDGDWSEIFSKLDNLEVELKKLELKEWKFSAIEKDRARRVLGQLEKILKAKGYEKAKVEIMDPHNQEVWFGSELNIVPILSPDEIPLIIDEVLTSSSTKQKPVTAQEARDQVGESNYVFSVDHIFISTKKELEAQVNPDDVSGEASEIVPERKTAGELRRARETAELYKRWQEENAEGKKNGNEPPIASTIQSVAEQSSERSQGTPAVEMTNAMSLLSSIKFEGFVNSGRKYIIKGIRIGIQLTKGRTEIPNVIFDKIEGDDIYYRSELGVEQRELKKIYKIEIPTALFELISDCELLDGAITGTQIRDGIFKMKDSKRIRQIISKLRAVPMDEVRKYIDPENREGMRVLAQEVLKIYLKSIETYNDEHSVKLAPEERSEDKPNMAMTVADLPIINKMLRTLDQNIPSINIAGGIVILQEKGRDPIVSDLINDPDFPESYVDQKTGDVVVKNNKVGDVKIELNELKRKIKKGNAGTAVVRPAANSKSTEVAVKPLTVQGITDLFEEAKGRFYRRTTWLNIVKLVKIAVLLGTKAGTEPKEQIQPAVDLINKNVSEITGIHKVWDDINAGVVELSVLGNVSLEQANELRLKALGITSISGEGLSKEARTEFSIAVVRVAILLSIKGKTSIEQQLKRAHGLIVEASKEMRSLPGDDISAGVAEIAALSGISDEELIDIIKFASGPIATRITRKLSALENIVLLKMAALRENAENLYATDEWIRTEFSTAKQVFTYWEKEKLAIAEILAFSQWKQQQNAAMAPGGIDLNTSNGMQWKISKDGRGVEMNIDPATIERIRRDGIDSLSPVILRMTPVTSIWLLIGIQAPALSGV